MSQAVALLTLRTLVRERSDTNPEATTGRYTKARLDREINISWRRLRALASDNGHQLYMKATAPAAMTAGALTGFSFGTVPMPADCVCVYGIDVTIATNDIRTLWPADWNDRNYHHDAYGGDTGVPEEFHVYNTGVEVTNTITVGTIAIYPAPDRPYTYATWYLPSWVDRTNDTDVFDCVEGWEDWVVQDVVVHLTEGDNDRANTYAIARAERDKTEAMVLKRATKIQRVGPTPRRDVRSIKRATREINLFRRP